MSFCVLDNVTKVYESGELVCPVKQVSFTVNPGEFISIRGESGLGKSTLLMLMGGLMTPTEGKVSYDGYCAGNLSDNQLTEWRAKHIGFLFQNTQLVSALTVEENILLSQQVGGNSHTGKVQAVEEMLRQFGLEDKRNALPHRLSGGQRRRAMMAAVMVRRPKLVLADEPTNDLDEHWASRILQYFRQWAMDGNAVVMVTHHESHAEYANKQFLFQNQNLQVVL